MNEEASKGGFFVVLATFLVAIALSQMPLSVFFQWYRPDWTLMVLVFWLLWIPNRVGLIYAFMMGMLLDLSRGSVLGLGAFSLTLIAFIVQLSYRRLRVLPIPQQAFVIFLLVSINQLIYFFMQGLTGNFGDSLMFLMPSVISAFAWPLIFVMLRKLARLMSLN